MAFMDATTQKALIALYKEAYEGSTEKWTWFTDNEPNSALLGTLSTTSAVDASKPADTSKNSIAAHAIHLLFSLEVALAYIKKEKPSTDWESSWKKQTVTDDEWAKVQTDTRAKYDELVQWLTTNDKWDDDSTHGALGILAHAAYHLGAIRQLRSVAAPAPVAPAIAPPSS
jgi:hypothetical protein